MYIYILYKTWMESTNYQVAEPSHFLSESVSNHYADFLCAASVCLHSLCLHTQSDYCHSVIRDRIRELSPVQVYTLTRSESQYVGFRDIRWRCAVISIRFLTQFFCLNSLSLDRPLRISKTPSAAAGRGRVQKFVLPVMRDTVVIGRTAWQENKEEALPIWVSYS